jgi:citrate lyase subunit beta/citryl-CoA lyase
VLEASVNPGLRLRDQSHGDGVVSLALHAERRHRVPKAESANEIDQVAQLADLAAHHNGHPAEDIRLGALIETGRGVLEAHHIAAHPRITEIVIGEADLGAELGIRPSADEREWLPIRSHLIVACAAAGIDPPVGLVSVNFRDLEALRASTKGLLRMGFRSRPEIHPAQIPVIKDVFTPSPDEVAAAQALKAEYGMALQEGRGVIVGPDGNMVDEATVREARGVIGAAALTESLDGSTDSTLTVRLALRCDSRR